MRWSEAPLPADNDASTTMGGAGEGEGGAVGGGSAPNSNSASVMPQIKNHSVTHHRGYLYCFGGYDGRRNHQSLSVYSLRERRWMDAAATTTMGGGGGVGVGVGGGAGGGGGVMGAGDDFDFDDDDDDDLTLRVGPARRPPPGGGGGRRLVVRGAPPPGRNGHTATLAARGAGRWRGRRRRRLRNGRMEGGGVVAAPNPPPAAPGDGVPLSPPPPKSSVSPSTTAAREPSNPDDDDDDDDDDDGPSSSDRRCTRRRRRRGRDDGYGEEGASAAPPPPPPGPAGIGSAAAAADPSPPPPPGSEAVGARPQIEDAARREGAVDAVDRALADLARAMGAMDAELEGGVGGSVRRRSATIEGDDDDDDDVGGKVARGMGDDDDDDGSDRPSDDAASVANDDDGDVNYDDATDHDDIDYDYGIGIDDRIDVNDNDDDDYGEEDAQIIIIGGWLGAGPYAADDTWVLDISGGLERLRWFRPPIRGTPPGPCNMHSADYIPSRGEVYVFRGGNGREYLNDLHALDVETYSWRKVRTRGTPPQRRANHSSALLDDGVAGGRSELFVFGGWNGSERLNDVHVLDVETSTWSTPRILGVKPHPRAGMTLTALRGRLFLFGGSGTSSKCFDDLQVLDREEMAWLDVTEAGNDATTPSSSSSNGGGGRRPPRLGATSSYYDGSWEMVGDPGGIGGAGVGGGGDRRGDRPAPSSWDVLGGQDGMMAGGGGGGDDDDGGGGGGGGGVKFADWRSYAGLTGAPVRNSANPNDEDTVPSVYVGGKPPGRRAGHTATAVGRHIYVFGGSCGTDYLNDFFVLDTDPPPPMRITEPPSPQLYASRLRHFYNDEEFSDVTFLVEGRKVYGHKLVLSTVSDCFRAMFMTGFRESGSEKAEIEIPNCSHGSFVTMMEYIYTGKGPRDIDVFGGDGMDRAIALLELADQFFLYNLKQIIEGVLQPAVNGETYAFLRQVAQKTNANQLDQYCRYFERNMNELVE